MNKNHIKAVQYLHETQLRLNRILADPPISQYLPAAVEEVLSPLVTAWGYMTAAEVSCNTDRKCLGCNTCNSPTQKRASEEAQPTHEESKDEC